MQLEQIISAKNSIIGVSSMLLSETGYVRAYKLLYVHVIVLAKKLAELPLNFYFSGKNLITFLSLFIRTLVHVSQYIELQFEK